MTGSLWGRWRHLATLAVMVMVTACGGGSSSNDAGSSSASPDATGSRQGISLALQAPADFTRPFCVRIEVSAADFPAIRQDEHYPADTELIEAVVPNIPAGTGRTVAMGIFEDGTCADLVDADWFAQAEGVEVLNSEVTVVNLDLTRDKEDGIGSVIVRGDRIRETVRLHGEVVTADSTPIADVQCTVLDNGNSVGEVVSGTGISDVGVLDTDVEVGTDSNQLRLECIHPNFDPTTKIAERITNPDNDRQSTFVATVVMGARSPLPGEGTPPRLSAIPTPRIPVEVSTQPLDDLEDQLEGPVNAHFPAVDGDHFFVSFPVRLAQTVTPGEVEATYVTPVLEAMGFTRGVAGLATPEQGVEQARADLEGLAQFVAREAENRPELLRPRSNELIQVMLGNAEPTEDVDRAFLNGEGMTFAQFRAGVERLEIQYPFQQVDRSLDQPVPIEHTLVLASRWEGQNITTIRGALFNNYAIGNSLELQPQQQAIPAAIEALAGVRGVQRVVSQRPADGPHLVLLPHGGAESTIVVGDRTLTQAVTQMRYAFRMILNAEWRGQEGPFLLWIDAETGELLKLDPLIHDVVNAQGEVWDRDPGIGTKSSFFQVDDASGGQYVLRLGSVLNRVDFEDDGFNADDVSIPDDANGSSATFANFDQAPINNEAQALCGAGTNKGFQQVNLFGNMIDYRQRSLSLGIFTPFPTSPWNPRVESASAGCNAWSTINFGACTGYFHADCPNYSDGTNSANNFMNFGHDNTVTAHEMAHNTTPRFTSARPADWCGAAPCAIPVGWGTFHDLADFWADHFESTNCSAGWVGKNLGGVDNSLNCLNHDEGGGLPRVHEVTTPFNPATPGDHFPEHRAIATGGYADMQIASAALWQVRLGMRSKCRWSGIPQFGVRFARALKETGFFGSSPGSSDAGIFRFMYDLEVEMIDQWATSGSPGGPPAFIHNGPHTTNKVTAGFARTGLFVIPYQCLDGDASTGDPGFCPTASGGENGGDAVVDIDDNDLADDITINGVDHVEADFLELGGVAPSFEVWTGPRYRLDGAGGASSLTSPSPCNAEFRVQVSTDAAFPAGPGTVQSPWITVDRNPSTAGSPECYGTWTPNAGQWTALQAGGDGSRIHYRATTRRADGTNVRVSTEPGGGLWTVPAPYAVMTADGQSDY